MAKVRFVGCDVHAASIAVAVAENDAGEVRSLGTIPNEPQAVARLLKKLGPRHQLRVCYEAGPTGYGLYRQLRDLGVHCDVVAPTLVPVKAGDRVKTDRRDARKLARCYRAGDLTAVWVPDAAQEALRDLVRAREAAKKDQLRARHRLGKFLLRHGYRPPAGMTPWTQKHLTWIARTVDFRHAAQQVTLRDYVAEVEHAGTRLTALERAIAEATTAAPAPQRALIAALQALRGIAAVSAVTLATELGDLTRFPTAPDLMGYSGTVAREHSSGARARRGGITKTGNAHVRRIVVEAAWAYRHRPRVGGDLRRRQAGLSPAITDIAWKAQQRLHARYAKFMARGKTKQHAVTAVGRELLGFIWAIGQQVATDTRRAA